MGEPTTRRDRLREIESLIQQRWSREHRFDVDATGWSDSSKNKYFACFPYPYMNGKLHLGHAFTLSKVEFAANFERLRGKHVLFPFGFHCTGMPIQASADRLKAEYDRELDREKPVNTMRSILESMGVPNDEVPLFTDPSHWIRYFPQKTREDLTTFGLSVDWRRSFITTDANPHYDSFVRWQFLTLEKLGKLMYGKRFAIWSPKMNQPCQDHDRRTGEGVVPVARSVLKEKVLSPLESNSNEEPDYILRRRGDGELLEGPYFLYRFTFGDALVPERIALNLAYQGYTEKLGELICLSRDVDLSNLSISGSVEYISFMEPAEKVIARSGDECVVCQADQWYLTYGEATWQKSTAITLANTNVFSTEVRNQFDYSLGWLREHACARSFGLGTRLPQDPRYVIDSLSDSTIYMAYYTIAHLITSIPTEQMTPAVWDYILLDGPVPTCGVALEFLERLRCEFRYWYPLDYMASGKDLVTNHLTFCLYNHNAIFPAKHWPMAFRVNGHLLLNGEKMAKQTGNFKTLAEACQQYGVDALRFALADAGDDLHDGNFSDETARTGIMRLFTQLEWIEDIISSNPGRSGEYTFWDRVFELEIDFCMRRTYQAYEDTNYRQAVQIGFFEMQTVRDIYRTMVPVMHQDLIEKFIAHQMVALSPICPHFCEYVWTDLLKRGLPMRYPAFLEIGVEDEILMKHVHYLRSTVRYFRKQIQLWTKKHRTVGDTLQIKVAKEYCVWQLDLLEAMRKLDTENNLAIDKMVPILKKRCGSAFKIGMDFVIEMKTEYDQVGVNALDHNLRLNEIEVLTQHREYICSSLGVKNLTVSLDLDTSGDTQVVSKSAGRPRPGRPTITF